MQCSFLFSIVKNERMQIPIAGMENVGNANPVLFA